MASTWDGVTDEQILDRDGWRCLIPGCTLGPVSRDLAFPHPLSRSVDHIVPLSRGGMDTAPNKRAAHLVCNTRRGVTMHPDDIQIVTPELAPFGVSSARKQRDQPECGSCPNKVRKPGTLCAECRLEIRIEIQRRVRDLRAQGLIWEEVARAAGLSGPGSAHNIAYADLGA